MTYSAIQKFVQRRHGFVPTTGWVTHVKALSGLPTRRAANRGSRSLIQRLGPALG
jgi:hypothetical protein